MLFLSVFMLASILLISVSAEVWDAQLIANPKLDPDSCGQGGRSSVCDPERRLGTTDRLNAALNVLGTEYEYPGCGGYEMAVVAVGSVTGGTAEDMRLFATSLIDRWGVGKAQCNNGLVLAMAIDDRLMHIASGRGAAEYISDSELTAIIERMKPVMKNKQYADAAEQAVSDVARILAGGSFAPSKLEQYGPAAAIIACLVGYQIFQMARDRKYQRCKKALTQIEMERAEAKAERYQAVSCPICLETFAETPSMQTKLLRCGHKFHESCVNSWEKSHGKCPICREVTQATRRTSTTRRAPGNSQDYDSYDDEYRFRIRRTRELYPDYVSQSMVKRWSVPYYNGTLVADTDFIRSSPTYKDPNSSSNSSGSSSSFGGGSSDGGGGAGGSW